MSEAQTEVAAVVAPAADSAAADAPAPAAAAPDDAAAPAPAADAADPKQEELTEKDLLGSATLVTFPDRALGVSIEADEEGPVYVASVKTFSAARGRVCAGDVVALVDGVAVPQSRDAAGWAAFVQGLKEGPRPLSVAFGRPPKEPAPSTTAARKTRPRAKRARDDEYDDNESDEELQAALQASRRDAGPAPVGRLAAPVKAQSTRKKYWRKLVSDDLAPRDAPLKFVWPNPKAHLTSKSGRKTAIAYEAYSPATSVSEFFALGGRPDDLAYDLARGFVVVTDMVDGPPPPKKARGAAARAAAAAAVAPPPPPVVKEEVAAVVTAPEDDKGPTVADLAAYLVSRGGTASQVDGWSVGKNPRGDTIFTDPNSGRVFRSKPEVARFLNVGQA